MNFSIIRFFNTTILILLLVSATAYSQWSEPPQEDIIIRGGWLFDGISNTRRKNTGIVIQQGKIVEVDANLQDKTFSTTNVIDLTDIFLST